MTSPGAAQARLEIRSARTLARVNDVYRRAAQAIGFSTYAVGFIPSVATGDEASQQRSPFLLLDWPRAWLELYAREAFAAEDIAVAEAARQTEPFTWGEVQARHQGASARIFAAAAEFGWHDGFVIPVHAPQAIPQERFGVAVLACGHRLDDFGPEWRAATVALSLTAFAQARKIAASGKPQLDAPNLREREREALSLVAEGLGDTEIAAAMGIARTTAHFHIERAKKHLGATTRAQAIAIALTQGLI